MSNTSRMSMTDRLGRKFRLTSHFLPGAALSHVTVEQIQSLLEQYQLDQGGHIVIEALGERSARARFRVAKKHLRPGDTVSGPTLMALADAALYAAVLGEIGLVPLAVTTNLTINFLKKPEQKDVVCDVKLLKLGKRLAIGEVYLYSEGDPELVAHVTGTYSIPPKR
jgi:uncharacterized protein (TIGR00369 family)